MDNVVPLLIAHELSLAESIKESHGSLDSVLSTFCRVAPRETAVLLTGETGTGKTRLARLIHDLSPRRAAPFLVVDCGSLSPNLIERELFGHVKGTFRGLVRDPVGKLAAVAGGTLLLDEVNHLPLLLQGKLLRALDDRHFEPVGSEVRPCLIAASSVPLEQEVLAGRFRADLYARLNEVAFYLPPLRQQRSAIAALALRFLREAAAQSESDVTGLESAAVQALERYDWPGNIRELRNVVERCVALCSEREVSERDLPDIVRQAQVLHTEVKEEGPERGLEPDREEAEVLRRLENNWLRVAGVHN
jgi:DNA-binding NtrC family response regulator